MTIGRYCPTPALETDVGDRIVWINLAAEVLLGHDLAGCRQHTLSVLVDKLRSSTDIEFLPAWSKQHWCHDDNQRAERNWVLAKPVTYQSAEFGHVDLRNVVVPKISREDGEPCGMHVYFHPLQIEKSDKFLRELTERWNHELMWEAYAVSYDRVLPRLHFYRELVETHVSTILAADAKTVLDLGAGTGNVTIPLLNSDCMVTAVDLGQAMLDHLRSKVQEEHQHDRLTQIQDNAESLPNLADASFDAVTISHVLYDMQQPLLAWNEALRLLRPGGVIVVTEPNANFDLAHLLQAGERLLREQGIYEDLKDDWARVSHAGHELKILERSARLRPQEIQRRLLESGYRDVELRDAYLGSCSTVIGYKPTD